MDQLEHDQGGGNPGIGQLLLSVRRALTDKRGSPDARLKRARAILERTAERQGPTGEVTVGGLAPWQARKVAAYVAANLDRRIVNDDLAAIARLTTCHFARAFRNSFGVPPHEYVIQRRIERAKALMLSTSAPLSAIALECGLADQGHFSRLFLKVVGENPRSWRREFGA